MGQKLGPVAFILQPLEHKDKGDFICELSVNFFDDLLVHYVPSIVILFCGPTLLSVLEALSQMLKLFVWHGLSLQELFLFITVFKKVVEDTCVKLLKFLALPCLFKDDARCEHH